MKRKLLLSIALTALSLIAFILPVTHAQTKKSVVEARKVQIAKDLLRAEKADSTQIMLGIRLQEKDSLIDVVLEQQDSTEAVVAQQGKLLANRAEALSNKDQQLANGKAETKKLRRQRRWLIVVIVGLVVLEGYDAVR